MDEVQAFIARNKHQFGYIMGEASRQWAAIDPVGALTVGPCVKQVEVYGEYFKLVDANERMHKALEELLLAFDVGDMAHTSVNGRGYAAIEEARKALGV
ncbi:hypothetical protein [Brevibacillus migulae]|uniref:hypothetical protein n=1 Tax=Brevibacillus migulae TaxID=1644114 RepID=UPI00106E0A33|nr:hypothetical protein [Brevibacillus migulae]